MDVAELAEVITEELIVALSPRAGFTVTGDEAQRGGALFEIDGRVSASSDDVRVFVQLRRARTGAFLFAETWSMPIAEAKRLLRDITDKIVTVLRVHM